MRIVVCAAIYAAFPSEAVPNDATTARSEAVADPPQTASQPSLIEEVIVQGEREHTTLKDTAHSVAVFTENQLRFGTEQTMTALYQRVPNVTTEPGNGAPIIRGMARYGIRGLTNGFLPTSGSLIDGYFAPSEPNLWDANQAEVQRGPENFVSAGGMGGLDAVATNDPTDSNNGHVEADWSPKSNERVLGIAYGAPVTDRVGYRASAYSRTSDGFTTNQTRHDDDWDASDEYLARLKLTWQPFGESDTELKLRVEGRKTTFLGNDAAVTNDTSYDPADRSAFDGRVARRQDEESSVYVELDHPIDDRWRVDGYGALIETSLRQEFDRDGTAFDDGWVRGPQNNLSFKIVQGRAFFETNEWQAYARQYVAYVDLTNARSDVRIPFDYDGPDPASPSIINVRFSYSTPNWWFIGTQVGAHRTFGRFSASASLLRAGQILHADRRLKSQPIVSTGNPTDDAIYDFIAQNFFPHADASDDLHDFTYLPSADVDYAITDTLTVGVKYERASRLAGVWFNPARGLVNTYDDEISDNFDAFIRAAAFDDRLTVRANLFYARIRDQQVWTLLSDTEYDSQILNAQRSHNDGVEIEATWSEGLVDAWVSLGLLHAQFDRVEVGEADFSGNDFPNAPPWTASVGFTYVRPEGLFAEVDLTCRPQARGDLENNTWVTNEGRQIVNARVGWAFQKFEVSLFGRNLLDDDYLEFHNATRMPGESQTYIPGDPREIGVTVSAAL
jgi:hypothetical protein